MLRDSAGLWEFSKHWSLMSNTEQCALSYTHNNETQIGHRSLEEHTLKCPLLEFKTL